MDQNCKLWVHSISAKIQNFEDFSNIVFALLETTSGQSFSNINNIWGSKGPEKPLKETMDAESIRKTF